MDFYVDSYFNNDGIHTTAINNAIIDCYNNGGGRVIFSSGRIYRSGTIYLLDNVELYFEDNAILMASDDVADFDITGKSNEENGLDVPTWENCDYNGNPTKYFIYGVNKKNVSITGNGIIGDRTNVTGIADSVGRSARRDRPHRHHVHHAAGLGLLHGGRRPGQAGGSHPILQERRCHLFSESGGRSGGRLHRLCPGRDGQRGRTDEFGA